MDLHTLIEGAQQAAPYALALLVALTALARAAQAGAHAFARWAATTPTPTDDELAAKLVRAADAVAHSLDWLGAWLPQISFGQRTLGGTKPPSKPSSAPPRALVLTLLLAIATTTVASGCAGPPQLVRQGTTAAALGLVAVDEPAAAGYSAAHARALEQHDTRADYDAAMRPWNELERSLRASSAALLAFDAALDAWGAGGESQWMQLGACAVVSLRELLAAADAVGLDVPDDLAPAVDMIAALAGSACPGRE